MSLIVPPLHRRAAVRVGLAALAGAATLSVALTAPAAASTRPPRPGSLAAHGSAGHHWLTWSDTATNIGYVVQQATNSSFSAGLTSYRLRGPGRTLSPYRVRKGTTYYFRVRAASGGHYSGWSNRASFHAGGGFSAIRVLSYNSLSASLDGKKHPGGTSAPFSQRRAGQLDLLTKSAADVIGMQETGSCLRFIQGQPCYRQIDSLADGLSPKYTLDNTQTSERRTRYAANYILYDSAVEPVGAGGTWYIIPHSTGQYQNAAYQLFQVKATGARFLFLTVHLASGSTYSYDKVRGRETATMLDKAKTYAANHNVTSVVYVGDFNSYNGEPRTADITGREMRNAHIADSLEVATSRYRARYDSINGLYRTARYGHGSIDHIYASGGVGVKGWGELLNISAGKFVGTIPSDHNPIYTTLAIPY
jgi:endonuclease/exonuclease/phosphatase family metal-dependent hydrolase